MRAYEGGVSKGEDGNLSRALHNGGYMIAPLSCPVSSVMNYEKVRRCNIYPLVESSAVLSECDQVCLPLEQAQAVGQCSDPKLCPKLVTLEVYDPGEVIRLEPNQNVILFTRAALPGLFSGPMAARYTEIARKPKGTSGAVFRIPMAVLEDPRTLTQAMVGEDLRPSSAIIELNTQQYTHFLTEPLVESAGRTQKLFQF